MNMLKRLPLLALAPLPLLFVASLACNLIGLIRPPSMGGLPENKVLISVEGGGSLTSTDGKLTLDVPPGALSEDTEITAMPISLDELSPELRELAEGGLAYRLEPDGLQFSQPITISLQLAEEDLPEKLPANSIVAFSLLTQGQNGEPEFLEEVQTEASLADGSVVVRGNLSHFSDLVARKENLQILLEQVEPREQPVGEPFAIFAEVADVSSSRGLRRLSATFSAGDPIKIRGYSPFIDDPLRDPLRAPDSPTETRLRGIGGSLAPSGSGAISSDGAVVELECVEPGFGNYTLVVTAQAARTDTDPAHAIPPVALVAFVECVAPTPTPSPTPSVTPTPPGIAPTFTPTPTPSVEAPVIRTDDGSQVTYIGLLRVQASGTLMAHFEVVGPDGQPVQDEEFFATLGDPPSDSRATHASGILDPEGKIWLELDVNWPPGTTKLHFFFNGMVYEIALIEVQ